jgi:hypothetical protein
MTSTTLPTLPQTPTHHRAALLAGLAILRHADQTVLQQQLRLERPRSNNCSDHRSDR